MSDNDSLYEVAVLFHPTEKEKKDGKRSTIVVNPTLLVCKNCSEAEMMIMLEIPKEYRDTMDRIEVLVRPFV